MAGRRFILLAALACSATAFADAEVTSHSCTATASLSYHQRGAEAQVETSIENDYCAASSGDYLVELTIREDGKDQSEKLRFPETWERDDDAPVETMKRYPIGDNVDLLRIRIRKLTCTCTQATDDQP